MDELKIIDQRDVLGKDFRIYGDFENPLFLAKDVAKWIEHSQADVMIRTVDSTEKVLNTIQTPGGNQQAWFLTEDGLYEVLMQSRKPIAKVFKKKVKEILKDVRKHGAYLTPEKIEQVLSDPDVIIALAQQLKAERERAARLTVENESLEIALNQSLQFYTVAKYNRIFHKGWTLQKCQELGKTLTAYCRIRAIEIRRCETNDERFGVVNSYPLSVWNDFMAWEIEG